MAAPSLRRLKARRLKPLADVCAGLGLAGPADHRLTRNAKRHTLGLLAKAPCLIGETFFDGLNLFETATLHGHALPLWLERAGAQLAFSSQVKATVRAVMVELCASNREKASPVFRSSTATLKGICELLKVRHLRKVMFLLTAPHFEPARKETRSRHPMASFLVSLIEQPLQVFPNIFNDFSNVRSRSKASWPSTSCLAILARWIATMRRPCSTRLSAC